MLACVDCDVIIIKHQELQQSSFFFILHFSCRSCVVEDVVVDSLHECMHGAPSSAAAGSRVAEIL
jgi:hypothetical protein